MFFSTELLSRRDSGFGLLWLAATLGSKTSFRKLPKRSVQTADIAQLCQLIAQPSEPLALRLSSNLMIGAVRVYKVKQELFMSDVQNCFNSLKKAIQDFQTMSSASSAQLQMGHPHMRQDVLTLVADPGALYGLEFDDLVAGWDEMLVASGKAVGDEDDGADDAFGARSKKSKDRRPPSVAEQLRGLHTLDESHDFLMVNSFDASFGEVGFGSSSSQRGLGMDFGPEDDLLGGLGDLDLLQELGGEIGWIDAPAPPPEGGMPLPVATEMDGAMGFDVGDASVCPGPDSRAATPGAAQAKSQKRPFPDSDKENWPPAFAVDAHLEMSPAPIEQGLTGAQSPDTEPVVAKPAVRKPKKKVRLLLDPRTELSDDELKAARADYIERQSAIRDELQRKQYEKDSAKALEDMIWGAPKGLMAPVLVDFWLENFKVQVEARSGALHIHTPALEPPTKRRRLNPKQGEEHGFGDFDLEPEMGMGLMDVDTGFGGDFDGTARFRSSEEPEQGRNVSRPVSVLGSILRGSRGDSLRGSLTGEGAPHGSSFDDHGFGDSSGINFDQADVRLSGSVNPSHRGNSAHGSGLGGPRSSPPPFEFDVNDSQMLGDDFAFNLSGRSQPMMSQASDVGREALEKQSMEYAQEQLRNFPETSALTFDDIVPPAFGTAHVAAATFNRILVLATKDKIRVEQPVEYGTITVRKK